MICRFPWQDAAAWVIVIFFFLDSDLFQILHLETFPGDLDWLLFTLLFLRGTKCFNFLFSVEGQNFIFYMCLTSCLPNTSKSGFLFIWHFPYLLICSFPENNSRQGKKKNHSSPCNFVSILQQCKMDQGLTSSERNVITLFMTFRRYSVRVTSTLTGKELKQLLKDEFPNFLKVGLLCLQQSNP